MADMQTTKDMPPDPGGSTAVDARDDDEFDYDESLGAGKTALIVVLSLIAAVAVPGLLYYTLQTSFDLLSGDLPRWLVGIVAIIIGVVGAFALYTVVDLAIKRLPRRIGERVQPYAWSGPAMVIVGVFLLYPAIDTIRVSFMDNFANNYIGFDNYTYVFTNDATLRSLRNTVLWVFLVPAICVAIGLGFAVLADKLKSLESVAKSLLFLPMAISFVGAGIVWRFVYSFRIASEGTEQIGIFNAIMVQLGQDPLNWLRLSPWNNLLLMVVFIWLQTGFSMVILSGAIKGVPEDILEAARIDGATEIQIFWRVVVPSIMSSITVVFTTMVIAVLKVFDIVVVMTNGQAGTEVIAERMIRESFVNRHLGRGAAIAVFMFLSVIPIMYINIRRFREEEAIR